ncbi:hypothetical protein F4813DRAFT_70694 [Daldinia decipiens]|uniref:uncharacterized protein n=1 Tax=Daldinia decipiens TaxID=326647 RepID=UPI0020C3AB1A|nr:uncharacterized protein F4813DRAFT_70694 [Daldinia decipiens]KAI1657639.1 hypothetical protein F4813DRAFT_70694 [Daldinia decipiens]
MGRRVLVWWVLQAASCQSGETSFWEQSPVRVGHIANRLEKGTRRARPLGRIGPPPFFFSSGARTYSSTCPYCRPSRLRAAFYTAV